MIIAVTLFAIAALAVWIAAGMVVSGVSAFAKYIKLSAFTVSFFVLGTLTSLPELSVGINAIRENEVNIFVGNLIGASIVLFLLVIPALAVGGGGIKLGKQTNAKTLPLILLTVFFPVILGLDGSYSWTEAIVMILLYVVLFIVLKSKRGIIEDVAAFLDGTTNHWTDVLKIVIGALLMYWGSDLLVSQTVELAEVFGVSTFIISLLVLGVGTNVPELIIGIRSIVRREKEIAFGNYVGSASVNTLLFGVFVLINGSTGVTPERIWSTFAFFLVGLILFWVFSRSNSTISRREGAILLLVYMLFVISEILLGR